MLPGGGQHKEETLADTVTRECLEEVDAEVDVVDLLFIREYIGKNHEFADVDSDLHQIEFMFHCRLSGSDKLTAGHEPDSGQIGIEWLDFDGLEERPLYPAVLRAHLMRLNRAGYFNESDIARRINVPVPIYLGDVN